ncbi:unnamed protein product [Cochlearia groenlandica]
MLRNCVNSKLRSFPNPIIRLCLYLKRGSASGGREEGRASSTAEEFTRQGVASQTVEKASHGAAETVKVSSESKEDVEKVKKAYLDKKGYYRKDNFDDDGLPINTAKGI